MALLSAVTLPGGISVSGAYIYISRFTVDRETGEVSVEFAIMKDRAAREAKLAAVRSFKEKVAARDEQIAAFAASEDVAEKEAMSAAISALDAEAQTFANTANRIVPMLTPEAKRTAIESVAETWEGITPARLYAWLNSEVFPDAESS